MDIRLDRQVMAPLYIQIRNQIRHLIASGQLRVGDRLPPERKLALRLGVNRTTVVNAYQELAADGLIKGHVGRGTLVMDTPERGIEHELIEGLIAWGEMFAPLGQQLHSISLRDALACHGSSEASISFSADELAPELYPLDAITECLVNTIQSPLTNAFRPSPPEGCPELRRVVVEQLCSTGAKIGPQHVVIISGRNQAWSRLAQILLRPGDVVVTETPAPLLPIAAFRAAGAQVVGVPLDGEGIQTDRLEQVLMRCRPKFIFTMPTFQTPSGVTMTLARRRELLAEAQRHRIPIVEYDLLTELWHETPPPPSLVALDRNNAVIHVGSWASYLLPGLQVGWLAGPVPVIETIVAQNQQNDSAPATVCQLLLASIAERGLLPEYLTRIRHEYRQRFAAMVRAIEVHWPTGTAYTTPRGGKLIWVRLPAHLTAERLLAQAMKDSVFFRLESVFHIGARGGREWILLNLAATPPDVAYEGMRRLAIAAKAVLTRGTQPIPSPG